MALWIGLLILQQDSSTAESYLIYYHQSFIYTIIMYLANLDKRFLIEHSNTAKAIE
jgi:hypothetical protein